MMTAWIQFENLTNQQVRAPWSQIADEIKKIAETEQTMFGGWGKLTFDGVSCDDFVLINGLHHVNKLEPLMKAVDFKQVIAEKIKQIEVEVEDYQKRITKLDVLRRTVESLNAGV